MEGKLDDVTIRPARVDDAAGIARVHIDSWREAYQNALPADYLASLDLPSRTEKWRETIAEGTTQTWIATSELIGAVGFASFGDSRDEDAERTTLELYSIYLEPEIWGKGVARNLMRTVLDEIPNGHELTLWVLDQNERARQFYRRHGFVADAVERIKRYGGVDVVEVRYRRK